MKKMKRGIMVSTLLVTPLVITLADATCDQPPAINPIVRCAIVTNYHLREANELLFEIEARLPEDMPGDIQGMIDEVQQHINKAIRQITEYTLTTDS